ncbi:HAD family phosphatase [Ammonicoccus fulvus]|uniref:HAD family phosphatase n=1 Tax=Ammonicoccus fulvus TaxID=3138240 RepID=A0ABZ3FRY7_9ACTN
MDRVDGVVFDCDGTLVDSEAPWLELIARVASKEGLQFSPEDVDSFRGLTVDAAGQRLAAFLDGDAVAVGQVLRTGFREKLETGVVAMPGAPGLVSALHGVVPLAVASNSDRADVELLLGSVGMLDRFDVLVCADDVAVGKPDPEPYRRAAEALGWSLRGVSRSRTARSAAARRWRPD